MTGLEKWKEDEKKRMEYKLKQGTTRIAAEIYTRMYECAYCKYHKDKMCLKGDKDIEASVCLKGIIEYLESEV